MIWGTGRSQDAAPITLLLTLLGAAGCGQLIGADDYDTAERPPTYVDLLERLGGAACRDCALSKCQTVIGNCEADPTCLGRAQCIASNPGMVRGCPEASTFEQFELFGSLKECANPCLIDCNVGRHWSCRGAFDLPGPTGGSNSSILNLQYNLDSNPFVGLDVRACKHDDVDCSAPQSALETTDEAGRVSIKIDWPLITPLDPVAGFYGYLELTSRTIDWRPALRYYPDRIVRDGGGPRGLLNGNDPLVQKLFPPGVPVDLSLPTVSVEVSDCAGGTAPDIEFVVTTATGNAEVYYLTFPLAKLDPGLTKTSMSGIAFAFNLEGTWANVIARFADSGEVIDDVKIELRPGADHNVRIRPRPRNDVR